MTDIKELLTNIGQWLFAALVGLSTWVYLSGQKESKERFTKLEGRMSVFEAHKITREDVDRIADNMQRDFKEEHKNIVGAVGECNRILREDISELRELVLTMIERRGQDKH